MTMPESFYDPAQPGKSAIAGVILLALGLLLTYGLRKLPGGRLFAGLVGFTGLSILLKTSGVI